MRHRTMRELANELNAELQVAIACNGKAHGIRAANFREARTVARVAEVAAIPQVFVARRFAFMTWRGAVTRPCSAKRQTYRMRPRRIFDSLLRQEKRAGHEADIVASCQPSAISIQP